MKRNESVKIILAEYYDGDVRSNFGIKEEDRTIEIRPNNLKSITKEIMDSLPAHIDLWMEAKDIRDWIVRQRERKDKVDASMVIGWTNTFDIEGNDTEWRTMQESGTEYALQIEIDPIETKSELLNNIQENLSIARQCLRQANGETIGIEPDIEIIESNINEAVEHLKCCTDDASQYEGAPE